MLETLTCPTVAGEQPSKQEGGGKEETRIFFPSLGGSERKEGGYKEGRVCSTCSSGSVSILGCGLDLKEEEFKKG